MTGISRRRLLQIGLLTPLATSPLYRQTAALAACTPGRCNNPTRETGANPGNLPTIADFIWPISGAPDCYLIGDAFGPRLLGTDYDWHRGIDIQGNEGVTPVIASAVGFVRISADCDERYRRCGKIIQIEGYDRNGQRYRMNYCHLDRRLVDRGERVTQGTEIGRVGCTSATWSHLHFEIREGDTPRNPYCYLPHLNLNNHSIVIESVTTNSMSINVSLRVTTPRNELDINEVRVRVLDSSGIEVDNKYINFNARHNCGTDDQCVMDGSTEICIFPENFWYDESNWETVFEFSGLASPGSGLVEVVAEARDCGGEVASARWSSS